MDHYIEFKLQPDPESSKSFLTNTLISKLHRTLSDLKATDIGVSFPNANNFALCGTVRLHSTKTRLGELMAIDWLGGMKGYCTISEIQQVPANCKHRTVGRLQPKMSKSKLNRLIKRGSISDTEASAYRRRQQDVKLDKPFIQLTSLSNKNIYRRYITLGELLEYPEQGEFDQFGLSKEATVPWF